jgi:hypothetical protein
MRKQIIALVGLLLLFGVSFGQAEEHPWQLQTDYLVSGPTVMSNSLGMYLGRQVHDDGLLRVGLRVWNGSGAWEGDRVWREGDLDTYEREYEGTRISTSLHYLHTIYKAHNILFRAGGGPFLQIYGNEAEYHTIQESPDEGLTVRYDSESTSFFGGILLVVQTEWKFHKQVGLTVEWGPRFSYNRAENTSRSYREYGENGVSDKGGNSETSSFGFSTEEVVFGFIYHF